MIDVVVLQSDRCGSILKYPGVVNMQEQSREAENEQIYGDPLKQNYI